jgi:hypothetical protein
MKAGQRAPRTRTQGLRARAWWMLRKNRSTTLQELLLTLNDGKYKNPGSNLIKYLRRLSHAGILERERIDDGKLTSNGLYRYTLTKDLGPQAPVIRKQAIYDPNKGEEL